MFGWLRRWLRWPRQTATNSAGLGPLQRIILTDGVARTLFEDYAEHRRGERGGEEIGWVLLGVRQASEAIALAALPAGAERDAGAAHVQFNSDAQALASRILRQDDKRLTIIGVVHTHPGSMRSPSDGDLRGDRAWVGKLRGGEGVFAIGTADAHTRGQVDFANVQAYGDLCFCWYTLGVNDARYRPLPVQVAIGNDRGVPLRGIWDILETHAPALLRLSTLLAKMEFEASEMDGAGVLRVKIPLPTPRQQLHLLLTASAARYYWNVEQEMIAIDPEEALLERAVFLVLAELAKGQTQSLARW